MRSKNKNILFLISTGLTVLLVGAFLYYFYGYPHAGIGPEQPIPFSHAVHNGVKGIQCLYCHPYAAYSNHPGLPPVEKCLHCHNYIISNHPWIQQEHRYYNTKTPTPWKKVNLLPEHVLFNHQRHINSNIACEQCHGGIGTMHRLKAKRWQMGECVQCHRQRNGNLDCWLACHS